MMTHKYAMMRLWAVLAWVCLAVDAAEMKDCMYDPEKKTWFSVCKPCVCAEMPALPNIEEASVVDQISSLANKQKALAQHCTKAANLDNLLHVTKKSLEQKLQDLFEGETEGTTIDLQVRVQLTAETNPEDVLQLLVNNLQPHQPHTAKTTASKLAKLFIPNSENFHFNPQVHFIPIVVAVSAIALYYRIIPVKFFMFLFLTISYIYTYVEQMEAYYKCLEAKNVGSKSFGREKAREFSYFNPVSWFSGKSPINGGSECDSAVRPMTVGIIMVTEHFLEPFPIFAKTLNKFVAAAFDDLSYFQWPIMMGVMFMILFAAVYFVLFLSGLTLKFRLLGGLLADCEVGRTEIAAIKQSADEPAKPDPKLAILCEQLATMQVTLANIAKSDRKYVPAIQAGELYGAGDSGRDSADIREHVPMLAPYERSSGDSESFRSPVIDSIISNIPKHGIFKNSALPPVTKCVGKNTCAFASLANVLPEVCESDIHGMVNFKEMPDGMDMGELVAFLTDTRHAVSDLVDEVKIHRPSCADDLKECLRQLQTDDYKIIANFHIQSIYTTYKPHEDYGHFSPILNSKPNEVCIGDVWTKVPDYKWVTYEQLYRAISTTDANSGQRRGIISFRHIPSRLHSENLDVSSKL